MLELLFSLFAVFIDGIYSKNKKKRIETGGCLLSLIQLYAKKLSQMPA